MKSVWEDEIIAITKIIPEFSQQVAIYRNSPKANDGPGLEIGKPPYPVHKIHLPCKRLEDIFTKTTIEFAKSSFNYKCNSFILHCQSILHEYGHYLHWKSDSEDYHNGSLEAARFRKEHETFTSEEEIMVLEQYSKLHNEKIADEFANKFIEKHYNELMEFYNKLKND
jgi:hypothetical protein